MATTTTNFGWTVPSDTDLVKDGAAAIRTALGGVDTSFVDLNGGTTGQALLKASGTDLDFSWGSVSSGMTLISTGRYTGASSYNIDSVLSTDYDNYLIVLDNVYLDAGAKMTMALRYGTSTQTSSYKYSTFGWKYSGITWNNGSSASASNVVVSGPGYISSSFFNLTIQNTNWVSFSGTSANTDDGSFAFGGVLNNVSQTWTGLQFSNTNAGTLNADISIYGRAK